MSWALSLPVKMRVTVSAAVQSVEVPPSDPRRRRHCLASTRFVNWIVCSGCRIYLCRCCLDRRQACFRFLTMWLIDPKTFVPYATWKVMDLWCWPSNVHASNFRWPSLKTFCCRRPLCRSHWLLSGQAPSWACLFRQHPNLPPKVWAMAPKCSAGTCTSPYSPFQKDLHLYLPCKVMIELSIESTH